MGTVLPFHGLSLGRAPLGRAQLGRVLVHGASPSETAASLSFRALAIDRNAEHWSILGLPPRPGSKPFGSIAHLIKQKSGKGRLWQG